MHHKIRSAKRAEFDSPVLRDVSRLGERGYFERCKMFGVISLLNLRPYCEFPETNLVSESVQLKHEFYSVIFFSWTVLYQCLMNYFFS